MEYRVFLGKYRVATAKNARWWATRRSHLGILYEADEIATGRRVVLELIPAFLLGTSAREALENTARLAREVRHPNLAALYELGLADDQFISVMEHVGELNADAWITSRGPMSIGPAFGLGLQVVCALRAATRGGLPLPAIYPANLTIAPDQEAEKGVPLVKVQRLIGPRPASRAFVLANTLLADPASFASPEQTTMDAIDFPAAIYSLGATLCFLLSGTSFPALVTRLQRWRVDVSKPTAEQFVGLPKSVSQLLAGMLAENHAKRLADPDLLEGRMRSLLLEVDHQARPKPVALGKPDQNLKSMQVPQSRRRAMKLAATLAASLVTAAALAVLVSPGSNSGGPAESAADVPSAPSRSAATGGQAAVAPNDANVPAAMNFAVVAPSYERPATQIQFASSPPGTALAQVAEPGPPAEGPGDPIVEVTSKSTEPAK